MDAPMASLIPHFQPKTLKNPHWCHGRGHRAWKDITQPLANSWSRSWLPLSTTISALGVHNNLCFHLWQIISRQKRPWKGFDLAQMGHG